MNVTRDNFEDEVLAASRTTPVLVDFWAPWCGPCRVLGPVLQRLNKKAGGRWKLAKINIESDPVLAQQFQITSIPAVKLFSEGRVVAEFIGALPEGQIAEWLDRFVPSPALERLQAGMEARRVGDTARAVEELEAALVLEPTEPLARMELAELLFTRDPDRALLLCKGLDVHPELGERAEGLSRLASLGSRLTGGGEGPAWDRYREGIHKLQAEDYDGAAVAFIDVIRSDRSIDDDGARKACIALFFLLGDEHPVTRARRPELASALF
jgi:putative thioredoxin